MTTSKRQFLPMPLMHSLTENSESFHSYLSRLAFNHGLTIKSIVDHAANWGGAPHDFKAVIPIKNASATPDGRCNDLISIIFPHCLASQRDLEVAACAYLYPSTRRSPQSFTTKLRWCPGCIAEQRLRGEPTHTKATWSFSEISACHIHRLYFTSRCPRCKYPPSSIVELENDCWCTHSWGNINDPDMICREQTAYGLDLIGLYQDVITRSEPYPKNSVQRFGRAFLDHILEKHYPSAALITRKNSKLARWADSSTIPPPTLRQLRDLGRLLSVPLENILSSEHSHTAPIFDSMVGMQRDELLEVLQDGWSKIRVQ